MQDLTAQNIIDACKIFMAHYKIMLLVGHGGSKGAIHASEFTYKHTGVDLLALHENKTHVYP